MVGTVGTGIWIADDGGMTCTSLPLPRSGKAIWSVAFDLVQPDTIFAGACPDALFRSRDGGQRWQQRKARFAEACPNVRFPVC